MRLKFLAKVLPIALCSLILVAAFTHTSYAAGEGCMAIPALSPGMAISPLLTCVPEPDPGIITYALGLVGVGIVALRAKFRR